MRYLIRGKFTAQALRTIQQQGLVDRVERAKEEKDLAAILFAINSNGHIQEEAIRIMTPEEMDEVIERSRSVSLPKG